MARKAIAQKGVMKAKNGRYLALITIAGKPYRLGIFDTPDQASAAYQGAAIVAFGEFACWKQAETSIIGQLPDQEDLE